MSLLDKVKGLFGAAAPAASPAPAAAARLAEAAGSQSLEETGWTRLSGDGSGKHNGRDLTPMAQERMQKLAEWLWQSNLLANRLVELPLAYLLAEGVKLQCKEPEHQKLLNAFWSDPINNWPLKLPARVRALAILGEQIYIAHVNEASGFVRLGYLDARNVAQVVMDPDNPEQAIGVVTRKDALGAHYRYKVIALGDDTQLFSQRTAALRAKDFTDGECFVYQINKLPDGSRGRSDLLGQMDWLDALDDFMFSEIDRVKFLRSFVWDVTLAGADEATVKKFDKDFKAPEANSKFVHNDSVTLEAKSPSLQAADTTETARLLRNYALGGATMPEHWFGGGGDVNRAAASEMGEPTFKVYTQRQSTLRLMLEEIGRYVLWKAAKSGEPDWGDDKWRVTAVFPELASKDLAKFSSALQSVASTVTLLIDAGLLTQERALRLIADVAGRFGQEIDAKTELKAAQAEAKTRQADSSFNLPADLRQLLAQGRGALAGATAPPAP